ncbi:PREDICTED: RNA polymerase II C-terminal domain phosphatase-like 4 [Tarenaya hassleriana]|uniref:RNA polymerase II C-terminal domain phosphatase-like 4 n=1 Tax=Tarenaya hassleriana TaxID=28532 RepID=UPI00053C85C3|nr:PREDICTED: RNA polymerase II C-terminal domain phosphatase-like 4 [Tarenaya hassleriana]
MSGCDHCTVLHGVCCHCGSSVDGQQIFKRCGHWVVRHGRCCRCGSPQPNCLPFDYISQGLHLSYEFVGSAKRLVTENSLRRKKKLHLVLGLQCILVHCRHVSRLSNGEKYLLEEIESRDDLWVVEALDVLVKLRPFVREFLREANEMFTMYVYTHLSPEWAEAALKFLDPQNVYFRHRVITCPDNTYDMKTLDLVLAEERGVVIIDNRCRAWWPEHRRNLRPIASYGYFEPRRTVVDVAKSIKRKLFGCVTNQNIPIHRDESEKDGALANALAFLKTVHEKFFRYVHQDTVYPRDVRVFLHP